MEYTKLDPITAYEGYRDIYARQMFKILGSDKPNGFGLISYILLDHAITSRRKIVDFDHLKLDLSHNKVYYNAFDGYSRNSRRYDMSDSGRIWDFPKMTMHLMEIKAKIKVPQEVESILLDAEQLATALHKKRDPSDLSEVFVTNIDKRKNIGDFVPDRGGYGSTIPNFTMKVTDADYVQFELKLDEKTQTLSREVSIKSNDRAHLPTLVDKVEQFDTVAMPHLETILQKSIKDHWNNTAELRETNQKIAALYQRHTEMIERHYKPNVEAYLTSKQMESIV
jgi:hypothetical protein